MSLELYNHLTVYGAVCETLFKLENPEEYVNWTEENFDYVRYNPRKDVNRWGLSLTSLDGGLSGVPDLDSIPEYNNENNTNYDERDFVVKTPAYYYDSLQTLIDPINQYIFRSHIIKLNQGGFFPPHRDFRGMWFDSFRIIIPLQNCSPPNLTFFVDDKLINWVHGAMYFVDTAKMHYLFNASFDPSYMIVLNVELNEDTVKFITRNLRAR